MVYVAAFLFAMLCFFCSLCSVFFSVYSYPFMNECIQFGLKKKKEDHTMFTRKILMVDLDGI